MRTICASGKGQIKVRPDSASIPMPLAAAFRGYGEPLFHSSEDTEALKDVLSSFGFEPSAPAGAEGSTVWM